MIEQELKEESLSLSLIQERKCVQSLTPNSMKRVNEKSLLEAFDKKEEEGSLMLSFIPFVLLLLKTDHLHEIRCPFTSFFFLNTIEFCQENTILLLVQ